MNFRRVLLGILFFLSCQTSFAQVTLLSLKSDLEQLSSDTFWINQSTRIRGEAFSGNYFSSADSIVPYSFGYTGSFPKICQDMNLNLIIKSKVRISPTAKNACIVISVSFGDSTVLWKGFDIPESLRKNSSWSESKNEINIPRSLTNTHTTLSVYLWNKDNAGTIDLDDFQIDFTEMTLPSFLPKGVFQEENNSGWVKMSATKSFNLFYNKEDGNVKLLTTKGDTIFKSIDLVSEWENPKNEIEQSWAYRLNLNNDSSTEEGMYFRFSARNKVTENKLLILVGNDGRINFTVNTSFLQPVNLYRHSVCLGYALPLKEVERKNKVADTTNFQKEYWLNKEGFILSNENVTVVMYRPKEVSSIQLDVTNRTAFLNLDFAHDHPLLHFPLMNRSIGKFDNHSSSVINIKDTLQGSFELYTSVNTVKLPRLLSSPFGYLSSVIWTEHADYTDIRTNKAVYYGSELINRPDQAIGGFVKYNIPVTKSIFYSNPDKVDNSEKAKFMPGPEASYKESPEFKVFLKQLHESGYEICLHTPDHYTANRKLLEEAMDVMHKEFTPVSWIDHGYDNGVKSNREDLMCDGLDTTSKWYSADLWKKYGLKYFWNSYYEDSGIYSAYSYNSYFSLPYSDWGDAFPTLAYWRNKRTANIVHWGTMNTLDLPDGNLWSYLFSDERLTDMLKNKTDIIIHCYPARVDSTNGFYIFKDNVAVANSDFNTALNKLASYRNDSKIWLTTIRQCLDYRLLLEGIEMKILSDGKIQLHNTNKAAINGLTLAAYAEEVSAGKKSLETKKINGELLFWFDLSAGEIIQLTLK